MLSNKGKLRHNADFLPFMLSDFVNTLSLYFSFLYTMDHLRWNAAAAAKSLQSCPTLCDPIDGSPPGSPVPGILKARTLEWVAISFSNAWKWKVKVKALSRVRLFATPWTVAHQAPPSMGFSRQEYWSGVPLPSPTIPGIEFKLSCVIETKECRGKQRLSFSPPWEFQTLSLHFKSTRPLSPLWGPWTSYQSA